MPDIPPTRVRRTIKNKIGSPRRLKQGTVWFGRGIGVRRESDSRLHPRLLLVLFRGFAESPASICLSLLAGIIFRRRGRFDLIAVFPERVPRT